MWNLKFESQKLYNVHRVLNQVESRMLVDQIPKYMILTKALLFLRLVINIVNTSPTYLLFYLGM